MATETYDVIVVGSGNAGFSSGISALETGAERVLLVEKSPSSWAGGNTTFTAGAYRTVFRGLGDIVPLIDGLPSELERKIDIDPYSEEDFLGDIERVTKKRADAALAATLVRESRDTTRWLARNGVRFQLAFNRQAYLVRGRYKFWGGMVLSVVGGGKGLTAQHQESARAKGLEIRYDSAVVKILTSSSSSSSSSSNDGDVIGVRIRKPDNSTCDLLATGGVILCAGGFEANAAMRAQYLGPGWDLAHVRGTPYNTGECLRMAISDCGAQSTGNWSGCHSTCWDAAAPAEAGDQVLTNQFTKSGYPLGVMANVHGRRFVDEGLDLRNFTYAKFGRAVLAQTDAVAFQIWDADAVPWLREEEYGDEVVRKITAGSIGELAAKLLEDGLENAQALVDELDEYNHAVALHRAENPSLCFDPSKKDGLSTRSSKGGLTLDKTNWALPIVKPPFVAVKVTCGVTFTFGGLKICPETAGVISEATRQKIPGLFCAGEMVGGLFYGNYPGGSGLTAGAVFGRKAGREAAKRALERGKGVSLA